MTELPSQRPQKQPERSQKPLWYAIGGLVISLISFNFNDQQIGVVVFWFGAVFAVISLVYWFVQPTHGFTLKK
jgi:hypothetical protein